MIINHSNLSILNQAFNAAFASGMQTAAPMWRDIATEIHSTTSEEHYGWLGQTTRFREWAGERVYQNLSAHHYTIRNRTFENTVAVSRDHIEDDRYNVYAPAMRQLGADAALHPDSLVFGLLMKGFDTPCHDGQYFFDTDHPVGLGASKKSVSNYDAGSGQPWFLVDNSKAVKPIIFQKRRDYAFTALTALDDDNVFSRNEFVWGADARCNVGFGMWQLAYASRKPLTVENFAAARAAHQSLKNDAGAPLLIRSTQLWVPPSLEYAARQVLHASQLANGASNVMHGVAEVKVCHWLQA